MGDIYADADQDVRIIAEDRLNPDTFNYLQFKLDTSGYKRLMVDSQVVGYNTSPPYKLKRYYDKTETVISALSTYTVFNQNFEGYVEFITVQTDNDKFGYILEIDGVKINELSFNCIKDDYRMHNNSDDENSIFLSAHGDKKQFYDNFRTPLYVGSNLTVKLKNNETADKKMVSYFIQVREL